MHCRIHKSHRWLWAWWSSPRTSTYIFKIHFSIIFQCTSRFSKLSLPLGSSDHRFMRIRHICVPYATPIFISYTRQMGKTNADTLPEGYVSNTSLEGFDWNRRRNSWSRWHSEIAFRRSSVRISISSLNHHGNIRRYIVCADSERVVTWTPNQNEKWRNTDEILTNRAAELRRRFVIGAALSHTYRLSNYNPKFSRPCSKFSAFRNSINKTGIGVSRVVMSKK
jgi:hypothetical protein